MDHTYIEEQQIADRYVQGTLPADEAERFENHYLSCPECLDRLDLAESVQRGFRRAATQDAERVSTTSQLALLAWLTRLSRRSQAGVLLSALLVLVIVPASLAFRGGGGRDRALAQARSQLAASARSAADREQELQAARQELAGERAAHTQNVQQLAQWQQPQGNFPILPLDKERGAGDSPAGPTQRLRLPKAGVVVLTPLLDPPFQPSYSAHLQDRNGREISSWTDLQPDGNDTLRLMFPASLLSPGDYSLRVEGLTPGAKPVGVGRFAFRVIPP
jgi:hypothetical protein